MVWSEIGDAIKHGVAKMVSLGGTVTILAGLNYVITTLNTGEPVTNLWLQGLFLITSYTFWRGGVVPVIESFYKKKGFTAAKEEKSYFDLI